MSSLTVKERKSKFNKLSNKLNIRLMKGCRKDIKYMVDCIDKGERLTKRPIDLNIKNEFMGYCGGLPFGILSYSSYIDLKK